MIALGTSLTGSREAGADLAHEAMLRAYRSWSTVGAMDRCSYVCQEANGLVFSRRMSLRTSARRSSMSYALHSLKLQRGEVVVGEDVESLKEVVEDLGELDGVECVESDGVHVGCPFEGRVCGRGGGRTGMSHSR